MEKEYGRCPMMSYDVQIFRIISHCLATSPIFKVHKLFLRLLNFCGNFSSLRADFRTILIWFSGHEILFNN